MDEMYHEGNRELQDRFDTRRLADRIEDVLVHDSFSEHDRAFIETRDMFFLATADEDGKPNVSYKGGDPGVHPRRRRAHARVPQLQRQRHVPV